MIKMYSAKYHSMLEESSKHNQIYETFKNLAPFAKSTVEDMFNHKIIKP